MLNLHDDRFVEYDHWNRAISAHYLTGTWNGRPLYLDMESSLLQEIAEHVGGQIHDPKSEFIRSMKATLNLKIGSGSTFQQHVNRLQQWERDPSSAHPPFVGLLAFFTLVAESMVSDAKFSSSNYYGRMAQFLDVKVGSRIDNKVRRDFRNQSHKFWNALNRHIFATNGRVGFPTAYALDSRVHVSIPISQALVRESDRRHFSDLFARQRLAAGSFPTDEMVDLINDWIHSSSVSSSFRTLWESSQDTRERIAAVACDELESWDGVTDRADSRQSRSIPIRIVANIRTHPRPELHLGLRVRNADEISDSSLALQAGSDDAARLAFETCGPSIGLIDSLNQGWQEFTDDERVSIPDFLMANILLKDRAGRTKLERRARQIVILKFEQENHWYVEVDRASLAVRHTLLVHQKLEPAVVGIAAQHARPGWTRHDTNTVHGCPEGWVLIRNIELLSVPEDPPIDMQPLVPTASAAIEFAGGLSLPEPRTWHAAQPPDVSFALETDKRIRAVLHPLLHRPDTKARDVDFGAFGGSGTLKLGERQLSSGEYRFSIYELDSTGKRSSRPTASSSIRLRSGEAARPLDIARGLQRPLMKDSVRAAISAVEGQLAAPGLIVAGGLVELSRQQLRAGRMPPTALKRASYDEDRDEAPVRSTRARSGSAPPCFGSSAHYWDLGTGVANERRRRHGQCRYCGLEQWHTTWPSRRRRSRRARATPGNSQTGAPSIPKIKLDPIPDNLQAELNTVFDAICLVGTGTWHAFATLARQVDDQPWFASELARTLAGLGHIEVKLNPATHQVDRWTIAPPVLVTLPTSRSAVLAGFRSQQLLDSIRKHVMTLGGSLRCEQLADAPARVCVDGIGRDDLELTAELTSEDLGFDVHVANHPSELLLSHLPHIRAIITALPQWQLPQGGIEVFDAVTGSWISTEHAHEPGAYRTRRFPRTYVFAPSGSGEARIGSPQLVKHLEAVRTGVPLIAYERGQRELIVRLGAQLPGLYERVAMLCSGSPPRRFDDGTQRYKGVPKEIAAGLWARLKPAENSP